MVSLKEYVVMRSEFHKTLVFDKGNMELATVKHVLYTCEDTTWFK